MRRRPRGPVAGPTAQATASPVATHDRARVPCKSQPVPVVHVAAAQEWVRPWKQPPAHRDVGVPDVPCSPRCDPCLFDGGYRGRLRPRCRTPVPADATRQRRSRCTFKNFVTGVDQLWLAQRPTLPGQRCGVGGCVRRGSRRLGKVGSRSQFVSFDLRGVGHIRASSWLHRAQMSTARICASLLCRSPRLEQRTLLLPTCRSRRPF